MQDMNNENTQRNRPQTEPEAGEQTMPIRAAHDPEPGAEEHDSTVKITVVRSMPAETGNPPQPEEVTRPVETSISLAAPSGGKQPPATGSRNGARRWPWILLGLLMIIVLGGSGVWMGYQSAIRIRQQTYDSKKSDLAKEYFMAGLVSQQNKQYEIARLQFEQVIKLQPDFPGAQDKLREVLTAQLIAMTPTPMPTATALPTMTPTKDLRPMEDIFNQARQQYDAKDWDNMFATLDQLRTQDPSFHAVEIDGMMYFAYRFRGVDKILIQANLEGGLYDLALAERYGPLDVDAKGYQNWARLYLNGASFWEVDWKKVVDYFEQIYPYFPNLMDSSHLTAIERYRQAAKNYGDQLSAQGKDCDAVNYYNKSIGAGSGADLAPTATAAELKCNPPTKTPEPTAVVTLTPPPPTPVIETPAAPTAEPTQAPPTVAPTQAPPPAEPTAQETPKAP